MALTYPRHIPCSSSKWPPILAGRDKNCLQSQRQRRRAARQNASNLCGAPLKNASNVLRAPRNNASNIASNIRGPPAKFQPVRLERLNCRRRFFGSASHLTSSFRGIASFLLATFVAPPQILQAIDEGLCLCFGSRHACIFVRSRPPCHSV